MIGLLSMPEIEALRNYVSSIGLRGAYHFGRIAKPTPVVGLSEGVAVVVEERGKSLNVGRPVNGCGLEWISGIPRDYVEIVGGS